MRTRTSALRSVALGALSVVLVLIGVNGAAGSSGEPLVVGRRNCSGPADDAACSGARRTTSLNWDRTSRPVPQTTGLIAIGDPGLLGATDPQYVNRPDGEIVGVEGFGNDWGGFFYGVDGGVVGQGETDGGFGVRGEGRTGVEAAGDQFGVVATGETAVQAQGSTALEATGAVYFSSAGLVAIPAGQLTKTVTPGGDINPQSKVLATVQSLGGELLAVIRHDAADSITIRLRAAATQTVTVAYFVIA